MAHGRILSPRVECGYLDSWGALSGEFYEVHNFCMLRRAQLYLDRARVQCGHLIFEARALLCRSA